MEACLWESLGRFHILWPIASIAESMGAMAVGDVVIKQCMCKISELAPYKSTCCCMRGGRGVEIISLLMLERVSRFRVRCALGHSDAMRAVPKYPPGSVSSC